MRKLTDALTGQRISNVALRRPAGRIAPLLASTLFALPMVAPA